MKRNIVLLLMLSCSFILFGCGDSSSDLGSEKGQSCAKQAIEAVNKYCDGTFSYERASSTLDSLINDMNYVTQDSDMDNNPNHFADFSIHTALLGMSTDLSHDNYKKDSESYDKLQDDISDIKKYIED